MDELEQWEEELDNESITEEARMDEEPNGATADPDHSPTAEEDDSALAATTQRLSLGGGSQTQPVAIPGVSSSLAPPNRLLRTNGMAPSGAVAGSMGSSIDGFQPGPSTRGTAGSTPESADRPRSARDKRQAAAPPANMLDGHLTPQNTAGPYVFDGTAGRAGGISAMLAGDDTVIAGV